MKITIFKNRQAVQISPVPTMYIPNGLKLWFSHDIDESMAAYLPIATTDVKVGKSRYYLPKNTGHNIYMAAIGNDISI